MPRLTVVDSQVFWPLGTSYCQQTRRRVLSGLSWNGWSNAVHRTAPAMADDVGAIHANIPDRFVTAFPTDSTAFDLQAGAWKFDYEKLDRNGIIQNAKMDGRPRFCAETFSDFRNFKIIELGPSDGYNTLGMELEGAHDIVSIEANTAAFLRCLILKNAMGLRAKFLLGDFLKYLDQPELSADLVYASGVLYHLRDPVEFLVRCGRVAPHLFLWSFYYDAEKVQKDPHERERFAADVNERHEVGGAMFTYHRRFYQAELAADPKYQGGLKDYAYWLDLADLRQAIGLAGYEIIKVIGDAYMGMPAMNIFAAKDVPNRRGLRRWFRM
jgi:hypothetical protein